MFVYVFSKDIQRVVQFVQESRLLQQNEKMYAECIYIVCSRRRRRVFFFSSNALFLQTNKKFHMIHMHIFFTLYSLGGGSTSFGGGASTSFGGANKGAGGTPSFGSGGG